MLGVFTTIGQGSMTIAIFLQRIIHSANFHTKDFSQDRTQGI